MPIDRALGSILDESLVADRDYPPFHRAMMDGYAVRLADAGRQVQVVGEVPAGMQWEGSIQPGACAAIMTGALCPPGTEAIVPKEDVQLSGGA